MNNKVRIGSFCKVRRGASPRPIDNPNYFGGDVGWIRISDVTKSFKYLNKTEQYVSPLGESLSVRVDKGDLIMSICGTIGRPIIINIPSCIHDGFVQLYDIQEANKEYLYYILQHHEKDLERKGQPGTQVNLNTTIVENFEIYFPVKSIQTKIALILSTCDAVIEKTQAAIVKYKAIKQGMLQDLFTRGIDLNTNKLRPRYEDAPGLYKESKLGMIPREWDEKSLEESTDYVDYRGKTPPKSDFGVFLVTAKNIRFGYIDYEISKEYIREDSFESAMSRGKVKLGDVLFTTEAPLGNVAQIDREDVALAQRVIKYRGFDNLLDNDYLALCLMSDGFQRQLFSEATGTTVLGIKGSRLHKLKITIPRLDEQRFIVKRLKAIDNKLQTEQTYLQKMQSLKKGLMEDLLSGRKCLNLDFQDEQINQDSKTILQSVNLVNQDADNYPVNPKIE